MANSDYDKTILADAPVIYLPMDDAVGSSTARDAIGSHTGTVSGLVTFGASGGCADGSTSAKFSTPNGFLPFGEISSFGWVPVSTPPVTIEFAAKFIISYDNQSYNFWAIFDTAPTTGFAKLTNSLRNVDEFDYYGTGAEWNDDTILPYVPPPLNGKWHLYHLQFYINSTGNRQLDIYQDGVLTGSATGGTSTTIAWTTDWAIGSTNHGASSWYTGWCQKFAIYSVKLTQAQILTHATAYLPAASPPKNIIYAGGYTYPVVVGFDTASDGFVGVPDFLAPTIIIKGEKTQLGALTNGAGTPAFTAVDLQGNLWTADLTLGSLVKFTAGTSGDVAPAVIISGSNTLLQSTIAFPSNPMGGIHFDSKGNLWAVANHTNIVMFSAAQCATGGNITPTFQLTGSNTGFVTAHNVILDNNDNIYIADVAGSSTNTQGLSSVRIFPANSNGNVSPSAIIQGFNTTLVDCFQVALNSHNDVYVVDTRLDHIAIWNAGVTGNVVPSATITNLPQFRSPIGVAFDPSDNLYVFYYYNNVYPAISMWSAGVTGNFPPNLTINDTSNVFLDPNLGFLAVGPYVLLSNLSPDGGSDATFFATWDDF